MRRITKRRLSSLLCAVLMLITSIDVAAFAAGSDASKRKIDAWDMGILVNLARAAYEIGYITKGQAWEHIEQAGILCSKILRSPEEIDKSFLLGKAMKSEKIEDWDRLLLCYSLLAKYRK